MLWNSWNMRLRSLLKASKVLGTVDGQVQDRIKILVALVDYQDVVTARILRKIGEESERFRGESF